MRIRSPKLAAVAASLMVVGGAGVAIAASQDASSPGGLPPLPEMVPVMGVDGTPVLDAQGRTVLVPTSQPATPLESARLDSKVAAAVAADAARKGMEVPPIDYGGLRCVDDCYVQLNGQRAMLLRDGHPPVPVGGDGLLPVAP